MTDKQIMIDGVDVHWCEHYTGNIGYLTDKNWTCRAKIQGTKCEDWSNCYFKRWQRKEQECERLKHDNGYEVGALERTIDNLKAENDELKRQHQGDKGLITATGKMNYQLLQEYDKLKTALTEIKEIAENRQIFCENCTGGVEEFTCDDCGYVKILQKISEVEDGQ